MQFINLKAQHERLKTSIASRIATVLDHGQYIMGPEVNELEDCLREFVGGGYCITVGSGTDALLISLMALGVGVGDEVITSSYSFISVAEVIALLGATPILIDVESDTCNIDVSLIEEHITERTKAIIPVSLYGQPADMDKINSLAKRHGDIPVIEDGAQSFGASYKGKRSCNLSTMSCTSFFPSKPLGCYGDGGAIFTHDEVLARACRAIRVHGQSARYVHDRIGIGGRMDTIQCAILLAKLEVFNWELEQRALIGSEYNNIFDESKIHRVKQKPDRTSVFGQYTVFVRDRDRVRAALESFGVPTAVHYPQPISYQPAYAHLCHKSSIPVALEKSKTSLSLPIDLYATLEERTKILEIFRSVFA